MSSSCCGSVRRNISLVVLSVLLVGCGGEVFKPPTAAISSQPSREEAERIAAVLRNQVGIVVASKDLPIGTSITRENVETLTTTKSVSKAALPEKYISDFNTLVGKRLTRSLRQDEPFNPTDVTAESTLALEEGKQVVVIPISAENVTGGFVIPSSRVDILAQARTGTKSEVFTLIPDIKVLAIDSGVKAMVTFAADEKQALLVSLAKKADCTLHLVLLPPDAPKREYDHDKTLARIKGLMK